MRQRDSWPRERLRVLQSSRWGQKTDVEAFAQGMGDSSEHGKRMSIVVGVFEPRDYRLVGFNEVGKFGLG